MESWLKQGNEKGERDESPKEKKRYFPFEREGKNVEKEMGLKGRRASKETKGG